MKKSFSDYLSKLLSFTGQNKYFSLFAPFFRGEFIKLFLTYSIGSIFLYGANFFLIPVYTQVLDKAEFGQIELISSLVAVVGIILSFGLPQVIFMEFFHLDKEKRAILLFRIISIFGIVSVPLFIIAFFISRLYSSQIFSGQLDPLILALAFSSTALTFFQSIFISIQQITKKAKKLTIFQLLLGLLTLALNIYLIYYLRKGVWGYFVANFLVSLASFIFIVFDTFRKSDKSIVLKLKIRIKELLPYFRLGFPFVLSAASLWLLAGADRWIILYFLSAEEVGIYSVAYKFASIYQPLLIIPVLNAYTPKIFERFAKGIYNQRIPLIFLFTAILFTMLALITPMLAKFMVDPAYYDALPLIPALITGYGLFFITQAIASLLIYKKRIKQLSLNILIASIANIFFNIIFVSAWGLHGAIIAFVAGHIIWLLFTLFQTMRAEKVPANPIP